jgi:hypothetical protein
MSGKGMKHPHKGNIRKKKKQSGTVRAVGPDRGNNRNASFHLDKEIRQSWADLKTIREKVPNV